MTHSARFASQIAILTNYIKLFPDEQCWKDCLELVNNQIAKIEEDKEIVKIRSQPLIDYIANRPIIPNQDKIDLDESGGIRKLINQVIIALYFNDSINEELLNTLAPEWFNLQEYKDYVVLLKDYDQKCQELIK